MQLPATIITRNMTDENETFCVNNDDGDSARFKYLRTAVNQIGFASFLEIFFNHISKDSISDFLKTG